jgi:hypothetical protein
LSPQSSNPSVTHSHCNQSSVTQRQVMVQAKFYTIHF